MRLFLYSTLLASFAVAACDDSSSPEGDTTADTTPDTTPGDTTPGDTTPDTTPDDTTPDDTTPGDTTPDTTPGDTTPEDTTPGDTTPEDTTPGDTTPEDTTPGDTTPEDTTPEDTAQDTTPEDTTPTNRAPTFTQVPAGDTDFGLPGDPVALTAAATDADGDSLTYTWTQVSPLSPVGVFRNASGPDIEFLIPELSSPLTVTLQLSVSDGVNPAVTGTVQIATALPRFASDILPIFSVCSGCHGASGGMSLSTANAYSNLVNVRGNNGSCNTLDRVEPGQPDNSLLVRKISGTTCGNRMPASDPSFFANDPGLITRIRSWILAGALNN